MDVRVRQGGVGHILIQRVRFHGPVDDLYDADKVGVSATFTPD